MKNKVIVIGLDGATFDVLRPWIEADRLPHLKAMMADGISGELKSCVPPVTAPAWTSFMTGKNPGRHGVFDFVRQEANYQFHPVSARLRHGRTLWEVIGEQGGTVVVMNVPMTHPPDPVNGVLISDFLLATGRGGLSHPPEVMEELEREFGPYHSDVVAPYFVMSQSASDIEAFITEYRDAMEYKFRVAHRLWDRYQPDFLMLHLYGSDQLAHWLWHVLDKTHPRHGEAEDTWQAEMILGYYQAVDRELGRWMNRAGEDTTFFVISDHGMGAVYKALDLNVWLYQQGYLVLKDRLLTRLRRIAWKAGLVPNALAVRNWFTRLLAKGISGIPFDKSRGAVDRLKWAHTLSRLLLSFHDIDWSRTRAFSPFGFGQIRINVQGQWAEGCVSTGAECEHLTREIVEKLLQLTDPETGQKVEGDVFTRDDVYSGEFTDQAPDIIFVPTNGRYKPNQSNGFTSNKVVSDFWGMTGIHKMSGILLAKGSHLRPGSRLSAARLIDLFPTILYLMGLRIPGDLDGDVLTGLFNQSFLLQDPIRFIRDPGEKGGHVVELPSPQEEADVIERLRGLGYLD